MQKTLASQSPSRKAAHSDTNPEIVPASVADHPGDAAKGVDCGEADLDKAAPNVFDDDAADSEAGEAHGDNDAVVSEAGEAYGNCRVASAQQQGAVGGVLPPSFSAGWEEAAGPEVGLLRSEAGQGDAAQQCAESRDHEDDCAEAPLAAVPLAIHAARHDANADEGIEAETEGEPDHAKATTQGGAADSSQDCETDEDPDGAEIATEELVEEADSAHAGAKGDIDTRLEEVWDGECAHFNAQYEEETCSRDDMAAQQGGWEDLASAPPEGGVEWKGGDLSAVSWAASRDALTSSSQGSDLSRAVDFSVKRAARAEMVAMASAGVVFAGAAAMVIRHISAGSSS